MNNIIDFPTKLARESTRAAADRKACVGSARILLFTGIRYTRIEEAQRPEPARRPASAIAGNAGPTA